MIKVQVRSLDGQHVEDHVFDADEVTIGRVKGNEVVLPVQGVSKRHARLSVRDGRLHVVDLKSTNGTIVRGQKITTPVPVDNGETFRVGDYHLQAFWQAAARPAPRAATNDDGIRSMASATSTRVGPPRDLPSGPVIPMVGDTMAPAAGPRPSGPPPVPAPASAAPAGASAGAVDASASGTGTTSPRRSSATTPKINRDATIRRSRSSATADSLSSVTGTRPLSARPIGRTTIPVLRDARPDIGTPTESALAARVAVMPVILRAHAERLDASAWPVSDADRDAVRASVEQVVARDRACAQLDPAARDELVTVLVDDVVGLGPLEHWLDDDTIDAVTVLGTDDVWLDRAGRVTPASWGFGAPELLTAAVRRLAATAGLDNELGGTIALADGTVLHVTGSESPLGAPLLGASRPTAASWSLDNLRTRGMVGPTAARTLTCALRCGAGVLLYGTNPMARRAVADALASEYQDARVVVCSDAPPRTRAGHLPRGDGSLGHAMALGVDLLVATPLDGGGVAELMATSTPWSPAIAATAPAGSPQAAVCQLVATAAAAHGLPFESVRAWFAARFPILAQVTMVDGTPAITRVHDQAPDGVLRPVSVVRSSDATREHYRMGPAPGAMGWIEAAVADGSIRRADVPDLTASTGGWVPDRPGT